MIRFAWFVCMSLCAAGVFYLASSDVYVNLSAAGVLGSTNDAIQSARYVAIGVVLAGVALGSFSYIIYNTFAQIGIWAVVFVVGIVSAVLTIQGVSVDYAANDQSGAIQGARQDSNRSNVKIWSDQLAKMQAAQKEKEKDCAKYDRWYTCNRGESLINSLADKIATANADSAEAERSKKIDITEAVYERAGIPGYVIERLAIYSRAIAIPLVIAILSRGFWSFFVLLWGDPKKVASSKK